MSGRLVDEVMSAAPKLRSRGATQREIVAALVVAEAADGDTRTGTVPRRRVAAVLGSSERTATRALNALRALGVISVVHPARRITPNADHGASGMSPCYYLAPLHECMADGYRCPVGTCTVFRPQRSAPPPRSESPRATAVGDGIGVHPLGDVPYRTGRNPLDRCGPAGGVGDPS